MSHSIGGNKNARTCQQCMSLTEKTEFPCFWNPYCWVLPSPSRSKHIKPSLEAEFLSSTWKTRTGLQSLLGFEQPLPLRRQHQGSFTPILNSRGVSHRCVHKRSHHCQKKKKKKTPLPFQSNTSGLDLAFHTTEKEIPQPFHTSANIFTRHSHQMPHDCEEIHRPYFVSWNWSNFTQILRPIPSIAFCCAFPGLSMCENARAQCESTTWLLVRCESSLELKASPVFTKTLINKFICAIFLAKSPKIHRE